MSLHSFLRKYQDWVLVAGAAVLLGAVIGFYVWGTNILLTSVAEAVKSISIASSTSEFLLQDAQKILNDRGLLK